MTTVYTGRSFSFMDAKTTDKAQRFAPVGSLVLSGYWGTVDQVLAHVTHEDWRGESVVVVEVAHPLSRNTMNLGRVREHSTPFDPKRDRIVGTVES